MKVRLLLCFVLYITLAQAQSPYRSDLDALHSILQKTHSYKNQIRGNAAVAYNNLLDTLRKDTVTSSSDYRYFYNLSRLIFPIRDNHLGFYTRGQIIPEARFPSYGGSLDSLRSALSTKPFDSLEGIYHYDQFYSVGLFRTAAKTYMGVVLDSDTSLWKLGQIAINLYEGERGVIKAIYAHPRFKSLSLYPVERFSNGALANSYFYSSYSGSVYNKHRGGADHTAVPPGFPPFVLRSIEPDIQYLHLGHFSAETRALQRSAAFRDSIKGALTAPYLILDLRNNTGGAAKASRGYLALLRKYTKKGKLFVLVNNATVSRGEIFTLQLQKLQNVQVLGQTTRGMLTYGSNMGKRVRLPSGAFEVYPTDMRGKKKLLPYEDYGVAPDVVLGGEADWVEQVISRIRK